ncbi:hypothetical protein BAUCODRAFT_69706 [Baudoinia panamericana UAMH 10762]|uniref:CMP/dCMP-type deaminase domain-containing protein n=1 Tax=Baudoinia panamericana (strain UAMH 10762) TaxID=717646 RepID=M2LPF8_BAUPA|nr:uncharacterized protein BAUCODRAFT_69706 [Baudoinia panamericana UAMH 10762]EMC96277.1 hypothetical protein BAUCODRAFT_69706 [Baudoinia panamericana UAMH 10762]
MVHLKTKEECRLGNETIRVYTVELPSKHAEGILKVIKENIEGQDVIDLQHLRRFAKPKYLPPHWSLPVRKRTEGRPPTLYLLVCPANLISLKDVHDLLLQHPPFCSSADSWAYPLEIKEITVPMLAPTSPEQAAEWSELYWPTFYRKTNPFGAHPSSISKAESELQEPATDNIALPDMMKLAEEAGTATEKLGYGIRTGCVIVERVDDKTEIIAVAGDARLKPLPSETREDASCTSGNVMSHAVMRAVGMIGRKRLRVASSTQARDAFFLDLPLTPLEQQYFERDNLKPDGYLCLKLEIFLTHEPCMMCSMALVHSRVGRVIFEHRMSRTGGLTAEMVRNDTGPVGLGYGLCWRKELNWQFMCWEYTAAEYALREKEKEKARVLNGNDTEGPDEDHPEQNTTTATTICTSNAITGSHDDVNANLGMPSFTSIHV